MSRILVHIPILKSGEYDIFNPTDYGCFKELIASHYNGYCPNVGNRLWFQGLISEISTPENILEYWDEALTSEEINERYDMMIAPMANIFSVHFTDLIQRFTQHIKGVHIPVFVIACGVQTNGTNGISELVRAIQEPAYEMIKAVYETGGEFALRGYVTKEFFDKMGFPSAVVTGCPSLYQCGRTSTLLNANQKVSREQFKPALNGKLDQQIGVLQHYPDAKFFDQEQYFAILHDPEFWGDKTSVIKLIQNMGLDSLEMIAAERVCLIADMGAWKSYLQTKGFNFSFGSRIHGSVMPILSGVPAVLWAQDARTSEIADFFNIPVVHKPKDDLYDVYMEADYSSYNRTFGEHFDNFENFLRQRGIVSKINTNNVFLNNWSGSRYQAVNSKSLQEVYAKIQRHKTFYQGWKMFLSAYRNLKG